MFTTSSYMTSQYIYITGIIHNLYHLSYTLCIAYNIIKNTMATLNNGALYIKSNWRETTLIIIAIIPSQSVVLAKPQTNRKTVSHTVRYIRQDTSTYFINNIGIYLSEFVVCIKQAVIWEKAIYKDIRSVLVANAFSTNINLAEVKNSVNFAY